ncbi:MAG: Xaa-Pro peptidase family protein [Chloroflexaceae bacterium]|jgi:Xaa-Pro aminopeptidase|nr:Xaa-Pro peptidase family protein [Chloroflexaceae bacterium]
MQRLENLRALMRQQELESLLITSPANRRYLSGFTGSNGALLISAEAALLFTDFRYVTQSGRESPAFTLRLIEPTVPLATLVAAAANELGLQQIGFEHNHMTVADHTTLVATLHAEDKPTPELVGVEGLVEGLREVKDAEELATLRRAIAITDAAISAVVPRLQPDYSEKQAAWLLEVAMRENGADSVGFPIIVAAGPNAALPHARPTEALLGTGRPIIIDMGAKLNGYHADLTRTVVLGEPDARFWEIYDLVLAAQRQAIGGLRAGLRGYEADALARDFISAAGYGANFGHGLGHGVGLDIHEGPGLRRVAADKVEQAPQLRAGAVFSVEPGIYLEGWGGVRIEDLVLLHDDHAEVLSAAPKLR